MSERNKGMFFDKSYLYAFIISNKMGVTLDQYRVSIGQRNSKGPQKKNALAQKQEFEWALCNEAIKEAFALLLTFLFISTVAGITTRTVEYFKH